MKNNKIALLPGLSLFLCFCLLTGSGKLTAYLGGGAPLIALAERSFVRTLDGGCSSPVAAYAQIRGEELQLTGFYVDEKERTYRDTITGSCRDGENLGRQLALRMKRGSKDDR